MEKKKKKIDKRESRTAYLTKYALTQGIQKIEVRPNAYAKEHWLVMRKGLSFENYKVGLDIFWTVEEAENKARKMAESKLSSLEKKRAELTELVKQPKWRQGLSPALPGKR